MIEPIKNRARWSLGLHPMGMRITGTRRDDRSRRSDPAFDVFRQLALENEAPAGGAALGVGRVTRRTHEIAELQVTYGMTGHGERTEGDLPGRILAVLGKPRVIRPIRNVVQPINGVQRRGTTVRHSRDSTAAN